MRSFVCIAVGLSVVKAQICSYTIQNATYNLGALSISSGSDRNYHLVHDADPLRNYSYYFNFCEPVHEMPLDICTNASKRPVFAQGYCKPNALGEHKNNECPAEDIIPITNNGMH